MFFISCKIMETIMFIYKLQKLELKWKYKFKFTKNCFVLLFKGVFLWINKNWCVFCFFSCVRACMKRAHGFISAFSRLKMFSYCRNLNPRNPEFERDDEEALLDGENARQRTPPTSRAVGMGGVRVIFGGTPNPVPSQVKFST